MLRGGKRRLELKLKYFCSNNVTVVCADQLGATQACLRRRSETLGDFYTFFQI